MERIRTIDHRCVDLQGQGAGRRVCVCLLIVAAAGVGLGSPAVAEPSPPAGPPTADGPTAARLGAGWLARQVDSGLPLQGFGGDQWGATVDAGLALASTGVGLDRAQSVWDAVVANRETVVAPNDFSGGPGPYPDDPGALAKVILFAHALGTDPRAVGAAPGQDLVARLRATIRTTGGDAGLYGQGAPTFDGSYRQGLAVQALVAVGETPAPPALSWLLAQQCPSGGWRAYRADLSIPCADDDVAGPETNGTTSALIALELTGASADAASLGVDWLADVRNADGGWGFFVGTDTDPNSTAGVLQALVTLGVAGQQRFAGSSAATLAFQLGCAAPAADRGAFTYPGSDDTPNLFATVQAVPAVLLVAAPVPGGDPLTPLPVVDCSTTTTTSTTSTTSTSTTSTTSTSTSTTTTSVVGAPTTTPPAQVSGASATNSAAGSTTETGASTSGSTSGSGLALTGGDVASTALGGMVLVLLGLGLVAVRRRDTER